MRAPHGERTDGRPARGQAVGRGTARGRGLGRDPSRRGRAQGDHRGRPAAAHLVLPQGGVPANPRAGRGRERRHGVHRHRVRVRPQSEAARALPDRGLGQRVDPGDRRQQARHRRRPLGGARSRGACCDGRAHPLGERGHGRGSRRPRCIPARRSHDRPARLVRSRQVHPHQPLRRERAARDLGDERGWARAAHDFPSRARAASFRGALARHPGDARAAALGRRGSARYHVLGDRTVLLGVQVLRLLAHERAGLRDSPGARGRHALAGTLVELHEAPARDPGARDPQGRTASLRGAQEVGEVLEGAEERRSIESERGVQADVHASSGP